MTTLTGTTLARLDSIRPGILLFVLFIVAFGFRAAIVANVHTDRITNDGVGYMRLGLNLATGRGYASGLPPHEPAFFREPMYPAFIALTLSAYERFNGAHSLSRELFPGGPFIAADHRDKTQFVKYSQAALGSVNVLLLFALMALVLRPSVAWLIALIDALYYPNAIPCTFILREVLQTTLVLGVSYCGARAIIGHGRLWLVPAGVLLGLCILTLQAMAVLGPVLVIMLALRWRNFKRAFLWGTLTCAVTVATISPWVMRTYEHFPDWRVVKSFGVGLTWEWRAYMGAVRNARYYGTISDKEFHRHSKGLYSDTAGGVSLKKSFNGEYARQTAELEARTPERFLSKRKLLRAIELFMGNAIVNRSWYPNTWEPRRPPRSYYYEIPTHLAAVLGLLSLLGITLWYKKLYPITVGLTGFLIPFYFLLSESRRIIPVSGLLLMFACLGAFTLVKMSSNPKLRQNIWQTLRKS